MAVSVNCVVFVVLTFLAILVLVLVLVLVFILVVVVAAITADVGLVFLLILEVLSLSGDRRSSSETLKYTNTVTMQAQLRLSVVPFSV